VPSAKAGGPVAVDACVTLLGPPASLHQELVARLAADVAEDRSLMLACEREDSLRAVLAVIDQLALAAMRPAGNA
jgi:hypothetical protein